MLYIFNALIATAHFPTACKTAIIKPLINALIATGHFPTACKTAVIKPLIHALIATGHFPTACKTAIIKPLINALIATGHFPTACKTAVIKPLIKKSGLDESLQANYHLVSNLPFLSKILEQVVYKQVTSYLSTANFVSAIPVILSTDCVTPPKRPS